MNEQSRETNRARIWELEQAACLRNGCGIGPISQGISTQSLWCPSTSTISFTMCATIIVTMTIPVIHTLTLTLTLLLLLISLNLTLLTLTLTAAVAAAATAAAATAAATATAAAILLNSCTAVLLDC